MEVAVRSFVGDVSRFLDASLSPGGWSSSCEARCRWQLQQLRSQLQQLLLHYPTLNPSPADGVTDDVTYDDTGTAELEYCDAGGSGEAVQEAYYDDTGGPGDAEEVYEQPGESPQEEYDELGAVTGHGGAGVTQELTYDDTAPTTEPYLPMGGKAARMLGLTEGGPAAPASSVPLVDPEVVSIQSQTSQDSGQADQVPAAELSSTARRWGRLQLRQEVKLWSAIYRPYWAGLANGRLYLYKRETDPAQKRAICLSGYEVRPPPPGADVNAKKRPSCFELVKPGGKTHQLLALTPKDARQWMAALEAEGVIAGKCEKEATEETPQRPPAPPPGGDLTLAKAAATAAAAAVPMERPAVAPPIEEDLYYEPEQPPLPQEEVEEEDIYEDISWSGVGRPRIPSAAQVPGSPVDDDEIYDTVGSPPPEPSWPAPVLAAAGRPTLGRTGALPALPPQALPTEPQSPTPPPLPDRAPLAPPSQPPGQPPGQPPPPPQRGPRGLTVSADPPPAAVPVRPPPPPQRSRGPPELPTVPAPTAAAAVIPSGAQSPSQEARIPSPPSDLLEEIYDELGDGSGQTALPPPSDPFYNVLEPEYLAPSPVPIKVTEDAPDEGYGNSSGGSEADGHAQGEESHYKTLPRQLRPFVAPGTAAKPASPATSTTENGSIPAPPAAPERPTQLPTANRRPRAATAGAGSVADVIRKLNRQSVDEEPAPAPTRPSARAPAPISADLARKQALIAGGVRALSPPGGASSGKVTANNSNSSSSKPKPTVLPPKPTAAAGRPKPKPAPPARQEARTASPGRKGGGESKPAAGLVPNKSGVYKTLKRMSDSERQPAGALSRRTDGGSSVPASPEEDDVYAEIDDDSWRT